MFIRNRRVFQSRAWVQLRLRQFLCVAPLLALVILTECYLTRRYSIGIDDQKLQCLAGGHRWFVIDHRDHSFERGDLVAFWSDSRMAPFFPRPTIFVKQVAGLPGDTVERQDDRIRVNGQIVADGFPLLDKPGVNAATGLPITQLEPDTFWVMGTQPLSFDSRYWGNVHGTQIIGKAYALPF